MTDFLQFGLGERIEKALTEANYTIPTPIQRQAIPILMKGGDLLGIAQTGTGKTAAFALPSLDYLSQTYKPLKGRASRMLVLAPTRELASQIAESFRTYGKFLRLTITTAFGGVPIGRQVRALQRGVDILVATPGRLIDLVDQNALDLSQVEVFVLDEADQMLDLGFIHALRRIVRILPKKRQSLFFSATMPPAIAELAAQFLDHPQKVEVKPQATTAERVAQHVIHVNTAEKQALLTIMLQDLGADMDRGLVFTRTKHGADRVVRHLKGAGIAAEAIHGNKSQPQRERALGLFRTGDVRILVATDIAARGIDVPGVSHVFNFELPNVPEQYVHRIGRTARAGREGIAIALVSDGDERAYLRDIERLIRQKLEPMPLPENFLTRAAALAKPVARTGENSGDQRGFGGGERRDGRRDGGHRGAPGHRDTGHRHDRGERSGGERREGDRDGQRRHFGKPKAKYSAKPAHGAGGGGRGNPGGGQRRQGR
ncbi:DEAD/DEAH box helicase [Sphingosinicella microcystinivorans]|uniref:DEAD/DEAH box helicase n=1 Tax=Sphingosinicella microcystinivorans TaxID=335406 RepID=UPI0022F3B541|nr:DEAD/DEAH box helicase [Sphingosinicella microcystinivorans]WBX86064.1 DEAD/DEAH box helicase [Sphingosinicella microcystinivorans]